MALYSIESEQCLGMSHHGAVTVNGESAVELSDQEVRDFFYEHIGADLNMDVEFSGRQTLRDSNNHVLGYYEPGRNVTVDPNYHVIGYGNILTTFL
jgi:hypothetical protein